MMAERRSRFFLGRSETLRASPPTPRAQSLLPRRRRHLRPHSPDLEIITTKAFLHHLGAPCNLTDKALPTGLCPSPVRGGPGVLSGR